MFKHKKKLFGENIDCNCEYCSNWNLEGEGYVCVVGEQISESGSCKKFSYDPLRRVPRKKPHLPKYSPEDFTL